MPTQEILSCGGIVRPLYLKDSTLQARQNQKRELSGSSKKLQRGQLCACEAVLLGAISATLATVFRDPRGYRISSAFT